MLFMSASRELLKRNVWNKGRTIPGAAAAAWRTDPQGWIIHFDDHGNHASPYGWEMQHLLPKSRGGTDQLFNLQPVNVSRRREGQDSHPWSRRR
jgi:hypothetical protein